jgi:prepilin-type N-terminal cleavage/methylation domain-containing protein
MARHALSPSATRAGGKPKGFTLIELMVSAGILVALSALLLPAVHSAREGGRAVVCINNERRLWQGWTLFAADHDGRLPGNLLDSPVGEPYTWDWLAGPGPLWEVDSWSNAPQKGTIFPYVNRDYRVYRCPSLEECPPQYFNGGVGAGSNGRFDYVSFTTFAGSHLQRVPLTATFVYPDGRNVILPTPIICEEEACTLNGGSMEGLHSGSDHMGHQHRGGGHYVSPDGAVNWFVEPIARDSNGAPTLAGGACAANWYVMGQRGSMVRMDFPFWWGFFDGQ